MRTLADAEAYARAAAARLIEERKAEHVAAIMRAIRDACLYGYANAQSDAQAAVDALAPFFDWMQESATTRKGSKLWKAVERARKVVST